MSLNNWFEKGIDVEAYIARLDKHKDAFHHIYQHFQVHEEDRSTLANIPKTRAIVIAAEWCGHCMLNIPIFLRIANQAKIDTRFIIRDDHPELIQQYETNGKQYIPIIIFIDETGKELAKWGPWANKVHDFTEKLKATLPDRDSEQFEQAFQAFVKEVSTTFQEDRSLWEDVYQDMKGRLLSIG